MIILFFIGIAGILGLIQLKMLLLGLYYEDFDLDSFIQNLAIFIVIIAIFSFLIGYHFNYSLTFSIRLFMIYLLILAAYLIKAIYHED